MNYLWRRRPHIDLKRRSRGGSNGKCVGEKIAYFAQAHKLSSGLATSPSCDLKPPVGGSVVVAGAGGVGVVVTSSGNGTKPNSPLDPDCARFPPTPVLVSNSLFTK